MRGAASSGFRLESYAVGPAGARKRHSDGARRASGMCSDGDGREEVGFVGAAMACASLR